MSGDVTIIPHVGVGVLNRTGIRMKKNKMYKKCMFSILYEKSIFLYEKYLETGTGEDYKLYRETLNETLNIVNQLFED